MIFTCLIYLFFVTLVVFNLIDPVFEWKKKELSIIIIIICIFLKERMFEFCLNLHFTRMFYFSLWVYYYLTIHLINMSCLSIWIYIIIPSCKYVVEYKKITNLTSLFVDLTILIYMFVIYIEVLWNKNICIQLLKIHIFVEYAISTFTQQC